MDKEKSFNTTEWGIIITSASLSFPSSPLNASSWLIIIDMGAFDYACILSLKLNFCNKCISRCTTCCSHIIKQNQTTLLPKHLKLHTSSQLIFYLNQLPISMGNYFLNLKLNGQFALPIEVDLNEKQKSIFLSLNSNLSNKKLSNVLLHEL